MFLIAYRPIDRLHTGFRPHAAGGNGDIADRHIKFRFSPDFGPDEAFQTFIPIQAVSMKRPIGRETHFEKFDVLSRRIFEQLPCDTLNNFRRCDAVLKNLEGFQHSIQILHLIIDFDMFVQLTDFIRRQLQVVFFGDINDRLRTDRAFEMNMNFRFWDIVVFGVEVLHAVYFTLRCSIFRRRNKFSKLV